MIEILVEYKELTVRQKKLLIQGEIDEALSLMEKKDEIFAHIQAGKVEGPQATKLMQEVVALNDEVVALMHNLHGKIGNEILKIQQGRQAKNLYNVAYDQDSYFLDKKN